MGAGSTAKRRRTGNDSSLNSTTPSRSKPSVSGRGRGRPPNAPRDGRERPPSLAECFKRRCGDVLDRLDKKDHYNIFLEPVNDVPGYSDIIKRPMDFTTMRTKLSQQIYKSLGEFRKDLDLIWSNCLQFNGKEPTNVYSKKAIELRRLTEKFIVSTRQQLEKDKENLMRWKEKHRKRRETMAANAATAAAKWNGGSVPISSPSMVHQNLRAHVTATEGRDPMSTDFQEEHTDGLTPGQGALAESLRLQYAGTSGLFKKGLVNAPFPQYTNPDGSVVSVPVVRYNPEDDHWSPHDPKCVDVYRLDSAPDLYCDSLPSSHAPNPCFPNPNLDSLYVKDYAESLYYFIKDNGPIACEIATELLSPELTIKAQHEQLQKKGLSLKEIVKCVSAADKKRSVGSGIYQSKKKWTADAIIELANDIENMNKRGVSILPKLSRSINELDGINGLRTFLDKDLVREVDEVPVQVVDFAMPYGVSLSTMAEICQLGSMANMNLSASDMQCIETLRKAAHDYLSHIGPEAAAKMSGASLLSPAQLYEHQLRAASMKRQRRMEAERQAAYIEQQQRKARAMQGDVVMTCGMEQKVMDKKQGDVIIGSLGPCNKDSFCKNCGTRDTLGWRAGGMGVDGVERLCIGCGLYYQKTGCDRPRELWTQTKARKSVGNRVVQSGEKMNGIVSRRCASPNSAVKGGIQKNNSHLQASRRSPCSSGSYGRGSRRPGVEGVLLGESRLVNNNSKVCTSNSGGRQGIQDLLDGISERVHGIAGENMARTGGNISRAAVGFSSEIGNGGGSGGGYGGRQAGVTTMGMNGMYANNNATFGNGGIATSEQMVESLLFGEGGMVGSSTEGGAEFDF